jgi:hypothetical protein
MLPTALIGAHCSWANMYPSMTSLGVSTFWAYPGGHIPIIALDLASPWYGLDAYASHPSRVMGRSAARASNYLTMSYQVVGAPKFRQHISN